MNSNTGSEAHQADPQLLFIIIKLVQRLKRDCYFCDLILLIFTSVLYSKNIDDIQLFICLEAGVVLVLGFIQYMLIVGKGRFVNRTAVEIVITADYVQVQTAAFKGPFWFKKESAELRLPRAETRIKYLPNPYPRIFKNNEQVIRLRSKGKEIFILPGYYSWRLEEDLKRQPTA